MKKQLRPLALFACIAALTAFGSQMAAADTTAPADRTELGSGQQHRQKGDHKHRFFRKMAKELNLTEQQKTEAKRLLETRQAENKPLLDTLRNEKHQLRNLVQSGSADEAAIRAQSAKVAAAEADLSVKRAQGAREFLALLTPEQAAKLKAIQSKRELRHKDRRDCNRCDEGPME